MLEYTKEKPTAPGWYWMRWQDGVRVEVARIYRGADGRLFSFTAPVSEMVGREFAGPLLPPGKVDGVPVTKPSPAPKFSGRADVPPTQYSPPPKCVECGGTGTLPLSLIRYGGDNTCPRCHAGQKEGE